MDIDSNWRKHTIVGLISCSLNVMIMGSQWSQARIWTLAINGLSFLDVHCENDVILLGHRAAGFRERSYGG